MVMGFHAVEAVLAKGYPVKSVHCLQRSDGSRSSRVREMAAKAKAPWREYSAKDKARFEAEFKRVGGGAGEMESCQGIFAEVAEPKPIDRKSTRLNSSHVKRSRMPSSA